MFGDGDGLTRELKLEARVLVVEVCMECGGGVCWSRYFFPCGPNVGSGMMVLEGVEERDGMTPGGEGRVRGVCGWWWWVVVAVGSSISSQHWCSQQQQVEVHTELEGN